MMNHIASFSYHSNAYKTFHHICLTVGTGRKNGQCYTKCYDKEHGLWISEYGAGARCIIPHSRRCTCTIERYIQEEVLLSYLL